MSPMQDWITTWTSLPNLHPALVHFPIVLLPVAVLCEVAGLTEAGRRRGARGLAVWLWVAAGLTAGLAEWAGEEAADSFADLPARTLAALGNHSDWGHYTWWTLGALAVLRIALAWWARGEAPRPAWPFGVLVLLGLGAVGMTFYTADLGGALVYEHGVGVRAGAATPEPTPAPSPETPPVDDDGPALSRWVEGGHGGGTWTPLPGDADALGSVLRAAPGSSLAGVNATPPEPGAPPGLVLDVDGQALLVLPGEPGDVQVTAELELLGFEGRIGLAHHVRSAREAGLLTVTVPAGGFALVTRRGDDADKRLDDATQALPAGPFRLAVSAAGRHLRGTLDGKLVVHGHEPALPGGACGMLVEGRGRLRILRLEVEPVTH